MIISELVMYKGTSDTFVQNMRAAHSRLISAVTKVDSGATDQTLAFLHDTIDFLYCTLEVGVVLLCT